MTAWFVNLSTRGKLIVGFGSMIVLLGVVVWVAYSGMAGVLQAEEALANNFTAAADLTEIRANMNRSRVNLLEMIRATDRAEQKRYRALIWDTTARNDETLQILAKTVRSDADLSKRLQELSALRANYLRVQDKEFELILVGQSDVAHLLGQSELDPGYEKLSVAAVDLSNRMRQKAAQSVEGSRTRATQALATFVGVGAVALAVGVLMALILNQIIAAPLKEVSEAAERIAVGDLSSVEISGDHRKDEVGVLTQTFSRMTQSLREVAGAAEQMAEGNLRVAVTPQSDRDLLGNAIATLVANLQHMTADTAEAVNVLSISASQILASTSELAASSTETAAAVTETTGTVEEIRHTTQVSSQKSRHVAESAQNAARIAQEGERATEGTTQDMERIRQQMNLIADSMVRLSEQSQAIGEIIATVDDLAQQSNLLAVNASIEAAKAGEQGKGFAVVAQEVKSLAEQSRQATMQVRGILSDIQKATGAAMMATEQGGKAVEAGVEQSTRAGQSIQSLAARVSEAAQAATQIAASSQQQMAGMDQVVLAMESVRQASTQNVDGARQLESAARNLADLGQRLKQQVERYQV